MSPLDPLLADLEEELAFDGVLCLHHFTWMQDIGGRPDEHDQILRTARLAYDEMRRRHPSARLGWVTWPHVTPGPWSRPTPGPSRTSSSTPTVRAAYVCWRSSSLADAAKSLGRGKESSRFPPDLLNRGMEPSRPGTDPE